MSLLYRLLPDHRQSILDERWMVLMTTSDTGLALAAEGGSVSTTDHDQAGPSHAVEDRPEATGGMPVASIVRLAGPAPAPDRR